MRAGVHRERSRRTILAMRILHLADRLTDRGGAYRHLLGVIARQVSEHRVHLAVGRDDETARAACETSLLSGLDARERRPVSLDTLAARFEPDAVQLHNVVNPETLEAAARLEGIDKSIVVQDHRSFCPGRGKWTADGRVCEETMSRELCSGCFSDAAYFEKIFALTEARLRTLASFRVEVLSEYMRRELVAAGLRDEAIRVVRPAVDGLDAAAEPDGPRSVLFVGRLVEAKGVWDAVAAWRLASLSLPLVFVGTGPLRKPLEEGGFEVLGWVPHARMASLYRRAACVLMPSRWQEPFGIAGLEALSMGAPVAAWNSGGIGEWNEAARGVAWGDVAGLARELRDRCLRT